MREISDRPEAQQIINDAIVAWRPEVAELIAAGSSATISAATTVREALGVLRNNELLAEIEARFAAL